MFVRGRVFSFPCSMQRFKNLLVFVKIILLKRDNCALALRKRLFYGIKQPFLQFQRAAFGMQDNGFHNILINKKLDNSYFCRIFLQYHSLPFVRKISSIRQKSTTPLHQWNKARATPSDRKSKKNGRCFYRTSAIFPIYVYLRLFFCRSILQAVFKLLAQYQVGNWRGNED